MQVDKCLRAKIVRVGIWTSPLLTQLNQALSLYFAFDLGRNYSNGEYGDVFIPRRKLKTTIKAETVLNDIENNSLWSDSTL